MELKMCPRHFCRLNKETSRHCQFRPEMGKKILLGDVIFLYILYISNYDTYTNLEL